MKGEKLETMQVSNLGKALEGAVAGVQIASSSGTPGSAASIRIRGIGSISASQEPLIVVDGVPYEG
jgi:outer membrane receptor for ferrienterochelin and colicin